jgi:HicB family
MMKRTRVAAANSRISPGRPVTKAPAAPGKVRMLHIRVSQELHRKLRLIVAAQETSLQDWIAQMLENAVDQASTNNKREDAP